MSFTFDQLQSGTKTIKTDHGYFVVIYKIEMYGNVVHGSMELSGFKATAIHETVTLTGESPLEIAEEMLGWLVVDMTRLVNMWAEELNAELN